MNKEEIKDTIESIRGKNNYNPWRTPSGTMEPPKPKPNDLNSNWLTQYSWMDSEAKHE